MEAENAVRRHTPRRPQRIKRVLHIAIICSFLLPFATVSSCVGDETEGTPYTGVELLAEDAGALLVGVILLAALLFAFSFKPLTFAPIRQGLLLAFEALLCAIAILTTFFATGIAFMFSRVSLQVGFFICTGSWILLLLLDTRSALGDYSQARQGCRQPPPPWGLVVGVLTVTVISISTWISEPNGILELLLGVFTGILIGVPITVLAMLSSVFYRLRKENHVQVGDTG
jgi:hypothetical protein